MTRQQENLGPAVIRVQPKQSLAIAASVTNTNPDTNTAEQQQQKVQPKPTVVDCESYLSALEDYIQNDSPSTHLHPEDMCPTTVQIQPQALQSLLRNVRENKSDLTPSFLIGRLLVSANRPCPMPDLLLLDRYDRGRVELKPCSSEMQQEPRCRLVPTVLMDGDYVVRVLYNPKLDDSSVLLDSELETRLMIGWHPPDILDLNLQFVCPSDYLTFAKLHRSPAIRTSSVYLDLVRSRYPPGSFGYLAVDQFKQLTFYKIEQNQSPYPLVGIWLVTKDLTSETRDRKIYKLCQKHFIRTHCKDLKEGQEIRFVFAMIPHGRSDQFFEVYLAKCYRKSEEFELFSNFFKISDKSHVGPLIFRLISSRPKLETLITNEIVQQIDPEPSAENESISEEDFKNSKYTQTDDSLEKQLAAVGVNTSFSDPPSKLFKDACTNTEIIPKRTFCDTGSDPWITQREMLSATTSEYTVETQKPCSIADLGRIQDFKFVPLAREGDMDSREPTFPSVFLQQTSSDEEYEQFTSVSQRQHHGYNDYCLFASERSPTTKKHFVAECVDDISSNEQAFIILDASPVAAQNGGSNIL